MFDRNLKRLYGMDLDRTFNKAAEVGNGPFLVSVVYDDSPNYSSVDNEQMPKLVNKNVVDLKKTMRSWMGGGFLVHSSADAQEFMYDAFLIFDDQFITWAVTTDQTELQARSHRFQLTAGEVGWKSMRHLTSCLHFSQDARALQILSPTSEQTQTVLHVCSQNPKATLAALNASSKAPVDYGWEFQVRVGDRTYTGRVLNNTPRGSTDDKCVSSCLANFNLSRTTNGLHDGTNPPRGNPVG